ncbi:Biosynthetic peptidoglycan transglycosylase [Streptomyces fumanus]
MSEAERFGPMGRAEERRARQRGGHRAAPRSRRSSPADGKGRIRRLFTWKKILGTFFGLCLLGMGAFIVLYMMIDMPAGNADARLQSNVYKYRDGSIMARDGDRNREIVDLAEIPKDVQHTFVAAENKTFYKDAGVDFKGTARGLLNTVSGKGAQGGSTITQQYVKNYYLTQDQTVSRKLKELVISLKLDREKSKDYILAGYINTSYYGRGAYGIQAAAQAYYRVDASDLTVEQGAYLAALLQAPNQYDWAIASETGKKLVRERWDYVLDNMVDMDWLDASDRQGMKFPVPKEPKAAPGMKGQTGYLVNAANAQLQRQLVADGTAEDLKQAEAMVDAGGWTVTLNIDKKKQAELEKSVKAQLTSRLDPGERDVDADVQAGAVSVGTQQHGLGHGAPRYRSTGSGSPPLAMVIRCETASYTAFKQVAMRTVTSRRACSTKMVQDIISAAGPDRPRSARLVRSFGPDERRRRHGVGQITSIADEQVDPAAGQRDRVVRVAAEPGTSRPAGRYREARQTPGQHGRQVPREHASVCTSSAK